MSWVVGKRSEVGVYRNSYQIQLFNSLYHWVITQSASVYIFVAEWMNEIRGTWKIEVCFSGKLMVWESMGSWRC